MISLAQFQVISNNSKAVAEIIFDRRENFATIWRGCAISHFLSINKVGACRLHHTTTPAPLLSKELSRQSAEGELDGMQLDPFNLSNLMFIAFIMDDLTHSFYLNPFSWLHYWTICFLGKHGTTESIHKFKTSWAEAMPLFSFYLMYFTRIAPKVMFPVLWCLTTVSEAHVGATAVEAEPLHQHPVTHCCCCVTQGSRGVVCQNGVSNTATVVKIRK